MTQLMLGGIIKESVVDGPGIRYVVFAQGCVHGCLECFNKELQPFDEGTPFSIEKIIDELNHLPHIKGITLSGGDPFEQVDGFTELACECKKRGLSVWCYTGYTYEQLLNSDKQRLLEQVDVLVDGPFRREEKDGSLKFRGSRNQRIIDVPLSLATGSVVLALD